VFDPFYVPFVTNHSMGRRYVPEKREIAVLMVLNDTFLGITDGLNDGFNLRCILSPASNTSTRFFTFINFLSRAAMSHAAFSDSYVIISQCDLLP